MTTTHPLTVIIPVYGPGPNLRAVVEALQQQDPPVHHIIVSHSGNDDPSNLLKDKSNLTVLHSDERLFAGAARNRGTAFAETPWLGFIDEDVLVSQGWHRALLDAISERDVGCVIGPLGDGGHGGYWGTSTWLTEFSSVHPHLPSRYVTAGASANMAASRDCIIAAGGFPEGWQPGEETVLQLNLRKKGFLIWFEQGMRADHVNVRGLLHMIRHQHRAGRLSAKVRRAYPELPASMAVRIPFLSLGLWAARLWLTVARSAEGATFGVTVTHGPGILLALLAWNVGFCREAFRPSGKIGENG